MDGQIYKLRDYLKKHYLIRTNVVVVALDSVLYFVFSDFPFFDFLIFFVMALALGYMGFKIFSTKEDNLPLKKIVIRAGLVLFLVLFSFFVVGLG